jgi:hypothetical protein
LTAIAFPEFAFIARDLANEAGDAAENRFKRPRGQTSALGNNDNGDAYRHFYWNFAMTTHWLGSPGKATAFGNAHEVTARNGSAERGMDLYNNAMGRAFGTDPRYSGLVSSEAADFALQNGCLQTNTGE